MMTCFENDKYQAALRIWTDEGDWGLDVVVRKNCTDIGFGWNFNWYTGMLQFMVPFATVNIGVPFHADEE